ncbi:MAG: hypothetical protein J6S68_14265 [Acinetobacter sp.]|nr:hypothetical protein [Acinetobacter sp.]
MNLIEQLGGYEETKKHLDSCWCDDDNRAYLLEKLLEHRRQHNIFEVGDYVVKTNPKIKHAHVRVVISTSPSGGAVLDYQGFPYKFPCIRHATPEEIKAGRRL